MQYRYFGKTGKKISILGFGGMRLPEDDNEAYSLVRKACDFGINYFDTAPSYCGWRSEHIIGQAVKDSGKKVYFANKSMVDYDSTGSALRSRLEASLKNMKTDKIDFYYMWDVSSWEKFERVIKPGGPLEGALKAKKEGVIGHIGLSTHADSLTIKKMIQTDVFECVTLGYNLINSDYRRDSIALASSKSMGVAIMNSLGGGVIPRVKKYLQPIKPDSNSNAVSLALKFVLMTPGVTVALSGMNKIQELEENIDAVSADIAYDEIEVQRIKNIFNSLGHTFCTYCWYCLPCPQKIPIPQYLAAWNVARLEGKDSTFSFIRENIIGLKNMSGLARECVECGQCESRCTQKLSIISILKEMGRDYDEFIVSERSQKDKIKSCT